MRRRKKYIKPAKSGHTHSSRIHPPSSHLLNLSINHVLYRQANSLENCKMLGCKCLRSHHVVCSASSPSFSPPDTPKLRTKKSHVQSAVSLGTFANYKLLSTSHDIDSSIIKKTSNFCISHLNVGLPESTARHQRSPT